jgi:hypothetical protein
MRSNLSTRLLALATLGILAAGALLFSLPAGPARAAESAPCSPLEGVLAADAADSIGSLLAARPNETIRTELEAAHAAGMAAEAELQKAQALLARAKSRIDIRKGEIDALKGRVKLAKDQKAEADQKALEAQLDAEKLQLNLLEAVRDLRSDEVDLAQARQKAGEARAQFLERELEHQAKLAELRKVASEPGQSLVVFETKVREAQRQALAALKDMAARQLEASKAEADVVDARFKVLEAQTAIAAPKD